MGDRPITWSLPASGERWADDYDRGRPSWLREAVDVVGVPSDATVLEMAAGTGKLTSVLVPASRRVIAVEPQDAMRRLLALHCRGAGVLAGIADEIPVRESTVDAVFVAEAFHHLGTARSVAEFARVLRPGGVLVLLWNLPAGPWEPSVEAAERLLLERLPANLDFPADPLDLNHRRFASGAWREAFAGAPFGPFEEARVPNPQKLDGEGLVAFYASMGWLADLPDAERLPLLDEVRALLRSPEYRRSWETRVHWTGLPASV